MVNDFQMQNRRACYRRNKQMLVSCAILLMTAFSANTSAQAFSIASPRENPSACGYALSVFNPFATEKDIENDNQKIYHVCNPDQLLNPVEMMDIDNLIDKQPGYFDVGILVIQNIPSKFAVSQPREVRVQKLAEILYTTWGVGNSQDNLGVLMLIAVNDRALYIFNGQGVAKYVTPAMTKEIITKMTPYLRDKKYADALSSGFLELQDVYVRQFALQNNPVEPVDPVAAVVASSAMPKKFVDIDKVTVSVEGKVMTPKNENIGIVIFFWGIVFCLMYIIIVFIIDICRVSSSTSHTSDNSHSIPEPPPSYTPYSSDTNQIYPSPTAPPRPLLYPDVSVDSSSAQIQGTTQVNNSNTKTINHHYHHSHHTSLLSPQPIYQPQQIRVVVNACSKCHAEKCCCSISPVVNVLQPYQVQKMCRDTSENERKTSAVNQVPPTPYAKVDSQKVLPPKPYAKNQSTTKIGGSILSYRKSTSYEGGTSDGGSGAGGTW